MGLRRLGEMEPEPIGAFMKKDGSNVRLRSAHEPANVASVLLAHGPKPRQRSFTHGSWRWVRLNHCFDRTRDSERVGVANQDVLMRKELRPRTAAACRNSGHPA